MSTKRVALHTLGCKVNHYETEAISEQLVGQGYQRVGFDQIADVYIINTCTVTNNADRKSRQMIRQAIKRNPQAITVVIGCYSQLAETDVAAIPGVDIIIGTEHKDRVAELIAEYEAGLADEAGDAGEASTMLQLRRVTNIMQVRDFEELSLTSFSDRTRASIKIQEGCNNFCTYCIIPWARGLSRSRDPQAILAQARHLVANGYREIVLTGIHTGGFGEDLNDYNLARLLRELSQIEGLERIRISSLEATQLTEDLLVTLQESGRIAKHLHIPLQAGSDRVLKAMKRNYDKAFFRERIARVREALPDVAITTDVITGFPGETDAEFREGYEFIEEMQFSQLHVFQFSKRTGTPAAKMAGQLSNEVKHDRSRKLIELSNRLAVDYRTKFIGEVLSVIPEVVYGDASLLLGHSDNYIPIVFAGNPALIGTVCAVRLDRAQSDISYGTLI